MHLFNLRCQSFLARRALCPAFSSVTTCTPCKEHGAWPLRLDSFRCQNDHFPTWWQFSSR